MNKGIIVLNKNSLENKEYMTLLCRFLELKITGTNSGGDNLVYVKGVSPQFTTKRAEGEVIPQYWLEHEYAESKIVGIKAVPVGM